MRAKFMGLRAVASALAIGTGAVLSMVHNGAFPAPFPMGKRRCWRVADVEAWIVGLRDVNGRLAVDRDRVAWDTAPDLPAGLLDLAGLVLEFPSVTSAVYFLVRGARVMYIGQSMDLPGRISTHRGTAAKVPDRWFDRVYYIPATEGALLQTERRYIKQFSPPWNIMGNDAALPPEGANL